jgi:hypothetical protein
VGKVRMEGRGGEERKVREGKRAGQARKERGSGWIGEGKRWSAQGDKEEREGKGLICQNFTLKHF